MKNKYYILTTVKIQKEKPEDEKNVLVTYGLRNAQKVANLCMEGDRIGACVAANKGL